MGGIIRAEKNLPYNLPLVAVLLTGSFLAILNQTLLITAIPQIMDDLQLTENIAQWVTTIFMLVNGIMIPISAFLMETFTTRRLFLIAMSIFALGTLICAFSFHFPVLMVGRIIQATGAGIMMPLMMTVFMLIFPIERRGTAMGTVGLVISFAPAIGPSLSGWLLEYFHWRALFFIIFPLTVFDLIIAYFVMQNIIKRTFPKVDYFSIILSTLGFGGLLYGFSMAGNMGLASQIVLISIIIGVCALTLFILRQFKLKQPILEFRVLSNKTYTITTIIGMIAFVSMISSETILPIYMQTMAGFSAFESGLMILPGALIMGIMSPINGRIFDKIGARWLLITGLSILTITTLLLTNLDEHTSFTYLTTVFTIRMFGISMVMMPATTEGLNQLPRRLVPHGTAMTNTMRQVSASIGTAMLITIMTSTSNNSSMHVNPEVIIRGVNIAFYVSTAFALFALVLSFYVKSIAKKEKEKHIA